MSDLFSPYRMGRLDLPNRIIMPSMTRARATNGGVPTRQMGAVEDLQRLRFRQGQLIAAADLTMAVARSSALNAKACSGL